MTTFSKIFVVAINGYQKYLSIFKPPSCRFFPTCSQYSKEAIEKYGSIKGIGKAVIRLLKCHPLHPGGYDPVR